ncbi:hypothetical protein AM493_18055 [Flavobacterium akiainvivens]|uniref:TonB C-terminal domain-containing protein n=1 Tax=Flavobacterium akiainvivens TaxID=1202724 RepID=A0A0M8ML28_9FLAO|nr:hypothetical protein [Flavobacterium akiainvivens]KOS07738.1 hypothetical protein AM493_18055 [Flavobacterium akiainvivens]SFQ25323.1 hypothetical protein SAMN05444144_102192 [Flavobacterium akiainvivens]
MKNTFCALLLSIGAFLYAQDKNIAYLPECKNEAKPKSCTTDKVGAGIHKLITKEIRDSIRSTGLEYFSVSLVFIIDDQGKVITSETRFLSEIKVLKDPVIHYISALPEFTPKGTSEKERRDVYFLNKTYILTDDGQDYRSASPEELYTKKIKPQYLKLDQYPEYPGCEGISDANNMCISQKLKELYAAKFSIPRSAKSGQVRMMLTFVINEEGEVYIDEIKGGSDDFQKEARRIFRKIPNIKPGSISGIPIKVSFTLPIVVNVG